MKTVKLFAAGILILLIFGLVYALVPRSPVFQRSLGLHYSTNGTKNFFEAAYESVQPVSTRDPIDGITVNHHLLAPNLIAKEFDLVATNKPVTVLLISPNHFFRGNGGAITSRYDWQTPYGILQTNQDVVSKLEATGLVNVDESPFDQEHGINGIVGFIKRSLPNATFVPLTIKDNLSDDKVDALAQALPKDALVVGSFDFSHYLTSNAAFFHDTQTLAAINNFDYDRISKLDVDSHAGMRLLLKYFDLKGDRKFVVTSHENSSTVTEDYSFLETTSYIDGYFTQGNNAPSQIQTELYIQGITKDDHWEADNALRLAQYNDRVDLVKPAILGSYNLGTAPIAVGIVSDREVTDIYFIPLQVQNHEISLLPPLEGDKILVSLGLSEHIKLK